MKYLLPILILLIVSCKENINKMSDKKHELFVDVYGDIGDSANFKKETIYLKRLNELESKLITIFKSHDVNELISFYERVIIKLDNLDSLSIYQAEIKDNCIASISDLNTKGREMDIEDIFIAWDGLRVYFAGTDINSKNGEETVTLSSAEYTKLRVYPSFLSKYESDGENDFVFAYKTIKIDERSDIIEFYELEY